MTIEKQKRFFYEHGNLQKRMKMYTMYFNLKALQFAVLEDSEKMLKKAFLLGIKTILTMKNLLLIWNTIYTIILKIYPFTINDFNCTFNGFSFVVQTDVNRHMLQKIS